MEHSHLERLAGVSAGEYARNPESVYVAAQRNMGASFLDQYIPTNPLTMGSKGYEHGANSATTGAERIVLDGICVDSPEAVVEHLETVVFPRIRRDIELFDEAKTMREIIEHEAAIQQILGETILKTHLLGQKWLNCLYYR